MTFKIFLSKKGGDFLIIPIDIFGNQSIFLTSLCEQRFLSWVDSDCLAK